MSLKDLLVCVKHYWRIAVGIPLLLVVVAVGFSLIFERSTYVATSTLSVSDPSGTVSADELMATITPIAKEEAAAIVGEVSVSVSSPKSGISGAEARVLTFSSEGEDSSDCIRVVNEVAEATAKRAQQVFAQAETSFEQKQNEKTALILEVLGEDDPNIRALISAVLEVRDYSQCSFTVIKATNSTTASAGVLKIALFSLVLGILLALCSIVLRVLKENPIRSYAAIEEHAGLLVLNGFSGKSEEDLLWANICFVAQEVPASVALVPVGAADTCLIGEKLLNAARSCGVAADIEFAGRAQASKRSDFSRPTEGGGSRIIACEPLRFRTDTVNAAHFADVTVLCVVEWADSSDEVITTLRELKIANANLIGIDYVLKK